MEYAVTAEKREDKNPREIRREGYIPAVVYGRGVITLPIQVDALTLNHLLHEGAGRGVIELSVGDDNHVVMVREIQRDPVKRDVLHVDFFKVSLTEKIRTSVPITVTGEEQVMANGGILQFLTRNIEVECLPNLIPDNIQIDVSELHVGQNISVGDLESSDDVEIVADPTEVLVTVVAPREEEVEEEPEEEGLGLFEEGEEPEEEGEEEERETPQE